MEQIGLWTVGLQKIKRIIWSFIGINVINNLASRFQWVVSSKICLCKMPSLPRLQQFWTQVEPDKMPGLSWIRTRATLSVWRNSWTIFWKQILKKKIMKNLPACKEWIFMGVFNGCLIINENDMNTKCWTQLYTAVSYINNVCPQFSQNISLNFQMTISWDLGYPGPNSGSQQQLLKLIRPQNKECVTENHFSYFATKSYDWGAQKNHLIETVLFRIQNTCFNWWLRK